MKTWTKVRFLMISNVVILNTIANRRWQIELVHTHGFPAGPLTWMPLMSLLVEHHPRLPGGTGAVEPLEKVVRYQLLLKRRNDIPWFVGAPLVDNSLVGEREATLTSSTFPTNCNTCRAISCPGPGTWGRVWNISAIFFENMAHTFVFFSFCHNCCHYRPAEGGRSDPSRALRRCQQLPHWVFHLDKQTTAINHQHLNDNYFPIPTQKITSYYHPLNISLSLFKTKHQTAMLSATGQLIAGIAQWLNGLLPRVSVPDKYTNSLIHSDP